MMHFSAYGHFRRLIGELYRRIHGTSSQQLACSDLEHGPSVLKGASALIVCCMLFFGTDKAENLEQRFCVI